MYTKVVLIVAMLMTAASNPVPGPQGRGYNQTQISVIALEESCVRQGGICVLSDECEPDEMSSMNLCPLQKNYGVVCCYSPLPEYRFQV